MRIDIDKSGALDREEILKCLKLSGFKFEDAVKLVDKIDKNKDRKIQLKEFLDFFENNKEYQCFIKNDNKAKK